MRLFVQTDPMLNNLAPKTDQDRISKFLLRVTTRYQADKWWEQKKTYQLQENPCIKYQVLLTQNIWIVCQIVRRITNKILGGERFKWKEILVEIVLLNRLTEQGHLSLPY